MLSSFQSSHQRLNLHNFTKCSSQSLELVTIVIIINVVFGKFSEKDLTWLAHVTVQLQVPNYSQLSDYTVRIIRVKYSSLCIVHSCGNCNCQDYYCYRCLTSLFVYMIRGQEQYGTTGYTTCLPAQPVPYYGWIGPAGWWRCTYTLNSAASSLRGWMFRKAQTPELYSPGTGGGYADGDWHEKYQKTFQRHHSLQSH